MTEVLQIHPCYVFINIFTYMYLELRKPGLMHYIALNVHGAFKVYMTLNLNLNRKETQHNRRRSKQAVPRFKTMTP